MGRGRPIGSLKKQSAGSLRAAKRAINREVGPKFTEVVVCVKCHGLVVRESDFCLSDENAEYIDSWRCMNCGKVHFK